MPQKAQRFDGQCLVDTKPENVLLAKDGRVVLTDFGIARAVEQPEAEGGQAGLLGTDKKLLLRHRCVLLERRWRGEQKERFEMRLRRCERWAV